MNFIEAVQNGNLPEVIRLVDNGTDVYNNQALIYAIANGYLLITEYLLNKGADIHARNDEPLLTAAWHGHLPIVKYLMGRGVDIHTQDDQALIDASTQGHFSVVEYLLEQGADIHAQDDQALYGANENDYLPIVKMLLVSGANINVLFIENQRQYQNWVPKVITSLEYYQIESNILKIIKMKDRYILITKTKTYILLT